MWRKIKCSNIHVLTWMQLPVIYCISYRNSFKAARLLYTINSCGIQLSQSQCSEIFFWTKAFLHGGETQLYNIYQLVYLTIHWICISICPVFTRYVRLSYLYHKNSYTSKTKSLYLDASQLPHPYLKTRWVDSTPTSEVTPVTTW